MNLVSRERLVKSNIDLTEEIKRLETILKEIMEAGVNLGTRDAIYLASLAQDALKTHKLRVVNSVN